MKTFASLLVAAAMVSVPALAADPSPPASGSSSLGTSGSSGGAASSTSPSGSSAMGSSGSMDQTAALESNTETVRQVESKLKSEGYDVGEVDGVMDDQARQALTQYQDKKGLETSGKLDSSTLAALEITDSQQAATPGSGAGSSTAPSVMPSTPSSPSAPSAPSSPSSSPSTGTSR